MTDASSRPGRLPSHFNLFRAGSPSNDMQSATLAKLVHASVCRVFGHEDAGNGSQREVLTALLRGFDHPNATILREPSLARSTNRAPDVVLIEEGISSPMVTSML
jgi:hypothetical protein